jgi:hypothetical protein
MLRNEETLWYSIIGLTYDDHSVAFWLSASRMIAPFVDKGASIRAGCGGGSDGGVDGDDGVVDVLVEAAIAALCALLEAMMGMEGEVADWQQ